MNSLFSKLVFPQRLCPGDTIGCVAPAGIVDLASFQRGKERLEARGYRLKTYRDLSQRWGYFAGSDRQRADELMEAFCDPETAAVMPVRGGYGCSRLLPLLDFDRLRRNPKLFIGFSDNTVLHAALLNECGLVTFHGPHICDGHGGIESMARLTDKYYWRAISGSQTDSDSGYAIELEDEQRAQLVSYGTGVARGPLVGGNLALVCTLLGTRYAYPMQDAVLLLEDTDEPPYRIDRFLSQLRLTGALHSVAAVLLGRFSKCEPVTNDHRLENVLQDYFHEFRVPVLSNFPVGHERDNITMPLGVEVEVDADAGRVTILQSATR